MSSISSNFNNNNFDNLRITKINKLDDSKIDSYVLRKHINSSIPNCFIQAEISSIPTFLPSLRQNAKSQVEEIQKLQAEISYVEEKVRDLETAKKMKLTKVIF
jgi:hypothetical protein